MAQDPEQETQHTAPNLKPVRQCNIQLPIDLMNSLKSEAHKLTGHQRRGLSELLAICAAYGWEAYQRGELTIDREPAVISYRLVQGKH